MKPNTVTIPGDLLTQTTAAVLRNVSRQAICNLIEKKRISVYKIGGVVFLSESEIMQFVKKSPGRKPLVKKVHKDDR